MISTNRSHWCSSIAQRKIQPSRHSMKQSGWIGFWPRRDATSCVYGQYSNVRSRIVATHSCVDTSTCSPRPRLMRASSAPSGPTAAVSAAWNPDWSPNVLSGGRSGSPGTPFSAATPPALHVTTSVPRHPACGPERPKGAIDVTTSRGLRALSRS